MKTKGAFFINPFKMSSMLDENMNIEFAKLLEGATRSENHVYTLTNKDKEIIHALRLLPGNREIKENRIPEIVKAIGEGIFMPPLIVSLPHRYVTDGNNRLVALRKCLEEGVTFEMDVYFYKDEQPLQTCRIINNKQRSWTLNERFHSYCFEKKKNYLALKTFMSKNNKIFFANKNWQLSSALDLLFKTRLKAENQFRNGKLPDITPEMISTANATLEELKVLKEIFNSTSVFQRDHIGAWKSARTRLGMSWDSYIAKVHKTVTKNGWKKPGDSKKDWFDMYIHLAGL